MQDDHVRHRGVITEINNDWIKVSIVAQSACASCHAKGFCGVSEMVEKVVEVKNSGRYDQKVGDFVNVTMQRKQGTKAVFYGYFLPFLLLMATLIISLEMVGNEGIAGLIALGILVPYYLGLYFLRDRIRQGFEFHLEKDNTFTNFNFNTSQ